MKKLVLVTGICLMLIAMPALTALPMKAIQKTPTHLTIKEQIREPRASIESLDIPEWAEGNITGVWGLNVLGKPLSPIGWLFGYYGNLQFVAAFWEFNATNVSGFIGGLHLGPFLLGKVIFPDENETLFVGLGGTNETHFYYRLMGIVGPTFYIYGIHLKFET